MGFTSSFTLTVKSQPNYNLKRWIDGMIKAFSRIQNTCLKRHTRNKGIKIIGIKSLECNFNPQRKTYNPHFHIICATKEIAELIKKEWIKLWKKKYFRTKEFKYRYARAASQHIRKIRNTENDLIEVIKYGAKIFTDPTMKKGKSKNVSPIIYAAALHEIYKAMDGHRLFGSFGVKLTKRVFNKNNSKVISVFQNWEYVPELKDWVNTETGQVMLDYVPDNVIEKIIKSNLDVIEK